MKGWIGYREFWNVRIGERGCTAAPELSVLQEMQKADICYRAFKDADLPMLEAGPKALNKISLQMRWEMTCMPLHANHWKGVQDLSELVKHYSEQESICKEPAGCKFIAVHCGAMCCSHFELIEALYKPL